MRPLFLGGCAGLLGASSGADLPCSRVFGLQSGLLHPREGGAAKAGGRQEGDFDMTFSIESAPRTDSRARAVLAAALGLLLCAGLAISACLVPSAAWAATDDERWADYQTYVTDKRLAQYNHGSIAISSDDAVASEEGDEVIEIAVGESATITVTPYQHVQARGCSTSFEFCPWGCGEGYCFVSGLGCFCDNTPTLVTATVTTEVSGGEGDGEVISVSDELVVDEELLEVSTNLGKTNSADLTVTGVSEGEVTLTVSVDGIYFWYPAETSYTVKVSGTAVEEDADADDAESEDAEADDSEAEGGDEAEGISFLDVQDADSYYYEAVYALAEAGYVEGYEDGNFGVGEDMSRAEFVTLLWRIAEPEAAEAYEASSAVDASGLSDVADGAYYTDAVAWAVEEGVVEGYEDGSFGVGDAISFQDLCVMIANYACGGEDALAANVDEDTAAETLADFADASSVSSYAQAGMAWCVQEGMVQGTADASLLPLQDVSRERAATVVGRCVTAGILA